jgi:hypothetical protein
MAKNWKMTLRQWQRTPKPIEDLIVHASTIEPIDEWREYPIGMCYQVVHHRDEVQRWFLDGHHDLDVLCCISADTDAPRRQGASSRLAILQTLAANGIFNTSLTPKEYLQLLSHFRFVISPEGNGIDCHRTYEALVAGCVPVVEEHEGIRRKYKGCPMLFTRDYSDVSLSRLAEQYEAMLDTEYDFATLFLSSYPPDTQAEIRRVSGRHLRLFAGTEFYCTRPPQVWRACDPSKRPPWLSIVVIVPVGQLAMPTDVVPPEPETMPWELMVHVERSARTPMARIERLVASVTGAYTLILDGMQGFPTPKAIEAAVSLSFVTAPDHMRILYRGDSFMDVWNTRFLLTVLPALPDFPSLTDDLLRHGPKSIIYRVPD